MKWIALYAVALLLTMACTREPAPEPAPAQNPFFSEWDTPYGVPPFDQIRDEHYLPAFKEGMKQEMDAIQAIIANPDPPNFVNTIEALESADDLHIKVNRVFDNKSSADTNDTIQEIAKEVASLQSAHQDNILLNVDLFAKIKAVHDQKDNLNLTAEQQRVLEKYYKDFIRGGANLDEGQKAELRKINEELAVLTIQFGENILKENNAFEMVIEDEKDLAGLPEASITAAAEAAEERGHEGKWVFTLHKPSMIPFLQYSKQRDLREKIFKGYINRGNNDNELDNKKNAARIAALRVKRAKLLGYKTHAHYVLEERMAKTPEAVYELLDKLWKPALAVAKNEAKELQALIKKEGGDFKLEPWDWWYYAEKLRKEKFDFDEEALRPYFKVEDMIAAVFMVSNKLFGITFEERTDIPKYHEDVKVFEVKDSDGSHIGILYTDYFPRASKRGGAWMSSFRKQSRMGGKEVTPIIYNVGNLSKPTGDKPALLSFEEVNTLFHEFGHALHGLLSDCTYEKVSGTDVAWDFVEMPSQVMENWAGHPEVMKLYAKHYETGEPIPDDLLEKFIKARKFNQGFATVEYLAASFLDMDWHTMENDEEVDSLQFEKESMARIGLIPEIVVRYRSPYFRHIFSGGYSSGYYGYIWAEVLDADAFDAFKEKGVFDRTLATSFRKDLLAPGDSEDPMVLYKRFRGREPRIEPLLEKRGLAVSTR